MANLNKVLLMGRLTRDVEVRHTTSGNAVGEFAMAVNRKYKAGDDTRDETTFFDLVIWGRGAEVLAQHVRKGAGLYVEGRLQLETWDDKHTGQKRSRMRVVVNEFQFLDRAAPEGVGDERGGKYASRPASGKPSQPAATTLEDDDIPF